MGRHLITNTRKLMAFPGQDGGVASSLPHGSAVQNSREKVAKESCENEAGEPAFWNIVIAPGVVALTD